MKKLYLLFIVHFIMLFLIGCEEESENIVGGTFDPSTNDDPVIIISHEDPLNFNINAYNFPDVDFIQFSVNFNPISLEYSSATISDPFIPPFVDSVSVSFLSAYSSSQSGDFLIGNVSFSDSGGYEGTYLTVKNLFISKNSVEIEGISGVGICFIDEGILIAVAAESPGALSEIWEPTGNYMWSNSYCSVGLEE